MTHLIALLLAALLNPLAAAPAPLGGPAHGPVAALQQPTPTPEGEAPPRLSAAVWLALACVFNLSALALVGAIALRRHIDRISPPENEK